MNAKCPFCSYSYEVVEDGKYQCGICGTRYYLDRGEIIVPENSKNRFGAEGIIVDRYRVIGELFPGSDEVMYCCVDELLGKLVCLRDSRPEEGYTRNNRNRFISVGDIPIPGKSVINGASGATRGHQVANIISISGGGEEHESDRKDPAAGVEIIPAAEFDEVIVPAPGFPVKPAAPVPVAVEPVKPAAPVPVAVEPEQPAAPVPVAVEPEQPAAPVPAAVVSTLEPLPLDLSSPTPEKRKNGKGKRWLILLIFFLLLIALAGGAYWGARRFYPEKFSGTVDVVMEKVKSRL